MRQGLRRVNIANVVLAIHPSAERQFNAWASVERLTSLDKIPSPALAANLQTQLLTGLLSQPAEDVPGHPRYHIVAGFEGFGVATELARRGVGASASVQLMMPTAEDKATGRLDQVIRDLIDAEMCAHFTGLRFQSPGVLALRYAEQFSTQMRTDLLSRRSASATSLARLTNRPARIFSNRHEQESPTRTVLQRLKDMHGR